MAASFILIFSHLIFSSSYKVTSLSNTQAATHTHTGGFLLCVCTAQAAGRSPPLHRPDGGGGCMEQEGRGGKGRGMLGGSFFAPAWKLLCIPNLPMTSPPPLAKWQSSCECECLFQCSFHICADDARRGDGGTDVRRKQGKRKALN